MDRDFFSIKTEATEMNCWQAQDINIATSDMKLKHTTAVTNIFSVLCRLEYIERMEKYRWQRIALQYRPREEGTQIDNLKRRSKSES
jgi:hypothetical protein